MDLKKVLIYIMSEGKGGVEEYVMNLARYTDAPSKKYGYLVMGKSTVYEEELRKLGVEYFFVPPKSKPLANINAYRKLLRQLRAQYDTIYFNTSGLYYPVPYLFAMWNKYRIVLHSHSVGGTNIKSVFHIINRAWIDRRVCARLSCSTPAGKWMFGEDRVFTLIPNAVKLERFIFNPGNREDCRRKYALGEDFVIGTVGRLHQGKNQVFLVEILKALLDRQVQARLLLVGDGDMRNAIGEKAEALGVSDRVVFAGQTDRSEYFYSAMDCFMLPSYAEGFPITLIEAQANGLPCVVSDRVTRETNISGRIEFLPIEASPQAWAERAVQNQGRYSCIDVLKEKGYDVSDIHDRVWKYLVAEG